MSKKEQINFIKQFSANVTEYVISDIESGKSGASWDGRELRHFLADHFKASANISPCYGGACQR